MPESVLNENFLDASIADDIRRNVERMCKLDPGLVEVEVENGDVTLSGVVPDRQCMREVYNAALKTSGVTRVTNLLLVKYS